MPKKRARIFSRAFKLVAVRRMMAGEDVSALSRELRVLRKDLYYWRTRFRAGGPEALRGKGRPKKTEMVPISSRENPLCPQRTLRGSESTKVASVPALKASHVETFILPVRRSGL